jgi:hypothetical protein
MGENAALMRRWFHEVWRPMSWVEIENGQIVRGWDLESGRPASVVGRRSDRGRRLTRASTRPT